MFWCLFTLYLVWGVPAWLKAREQINDMRDAKHYGYDYY